MWAKEPLMAFLWTSAGLITERVWNILHACMVAKQTYICMHNCVCRCRWCRSRWTQAVKSKRDSKKNISAAFHACVRICRNSDAAQSTSYLTITLSLSLSLSPAENGPALLFTTSYIFIDIYLFHHSFFSSFDTVLIKLIKLCHVYVQFLHSFRKSFLTPPPPPPGNRGFHTSCKYDCTVSMVFLKGWMDKTFSSAHQTLLLKALKTWDWLRYMISTSVCIKVASGCMHGGCWSSIWLQIKLSTFTLLN